jgi:glycerol-3-phosphate dehydrogenase (NAD(P)+)
MQFGGPPRPLTTYHERTRRRGVNTIVYWIVRAVLQPVLQIYFRTGRMGRGHLPKRGGVLLAPNHRSFLDPFLIGTCVRRPIYFMAKQEMFRGRFRSWILNCMGAFPVRRGESDEEAMETARLLVEQGKVVVVFPEGTRIRSGSLGAPKSGVGRLALETGAPVVPIAVIGSERARRGWRVRPVKVRIRLGRTLTFPSVDAPSAHLAREVTARIWPCVELQWEWLGGLPPLRKAVVLGGTRAVGLADLLARAGLDTRVSDAADVEFAGIDLVCFALPSRELPEALDRLGPRIGQRSALLIQLDEVAAPRGIAPALDLGERTHARAIATLTESAEPGGSNGHRASSRFVLATDNADFRAQFSDVLTKAGIDVATSDERIAPARPRTATGRFRERATAGLRG